jgi:hypothetical protein
MAKGLFGRLSIEDVEVEETLVEDIDINAVREKDGEYAEAVVEGEQHIADIHEAMDIQEEAEEKVVALESLQAHEFTPYIAKDAEMYYRTLCKRVGMSYETISTENADTAIHLSTEGIKEFIKTMVDAIKAIIKKIVNFFKRMFGIAIDVANNDEKVAAKEANSIKEAIKEDPSTTGMIDEVNKILGESLVADKSEDVAKKLGEAMGRYVKTKKGNTASSEDLDLSNEDYASNMMSIVNSYTGIVNRHLSTIAVCEMYDIDTDMEKIYHNTITGGSALITHFTNVLTNPILKTSLTDFTKNGEDVNALDKIVAISNVIKMSAGHYKHLTADDINKLGYVEHNFTENNVTITPIATTGISISFLVAGFDEETDKSIIKVVKTKLTKKAIDKINTTHSNKIFTKLLHTSNTQNLVNLVKQNKATISTIREKGTHALTEISKLIDIASRIADEANEKNKNNAAVVNVLRDISISLPSMANELTGALIYADKSLIKILNHNRMLALMNHK